MKRKQEVKSGRIMVHTTGILTPPRKKKSKGSGFDLVGSNPSSATDEQCDLEQTFQFFKFLVIHLTVSVCV